MPRRHHRPESVHPYRWMVSYADFMTLLFAFFVVMYAISSVNDKKFDELTNPLVGVFEGANRSLLPFQVDSIFPSLSPTSDLTLVSSQDGEDPEPPGDVLEILQAAVNPDIEDNQFNLQINEKWLQLEIPSDSLFNKKSSELSFDGEQVLVKLAKSFKRFENPINIEVFNDDQIAQNVSPWLLSAMQGGTIADFLSLEDIKSRRLATVAYGPYQPVATNDDEDGRSLNRRIVFLIDRTVIERERLKIVTNKHLSAKP